jgi:hypothetical protein
MRVTEEEIESMKRELCEQLGSEVEPAVVADFATRALARILGDYQALRRENAKLRGGNTAALRCA